MAQVFWVIAYAIIGYGAYWLILRQENYYEMKLFKRFKGTGYLAVTKYMERKCLWYPKKLNFIVFVFIWFIVMVFIGAAWPIVVIVTAIWNAVDYRITLNEGEKIINK